uniref:MARVEL domain-containing protein n=1 Tax=Parascaris univalens TaxID=6257 RepID=A0A915BRN0_PARUN
MSSCSPMLTPPNGITPTKEHFPLPAGAILRERHNSRKTIYCGRLPANALLGIIIFVHTSFIAIWMLREYYFFDFKCAIIDYEFGSSADIDKRKPTRSLESNAIWSKYGRGRGPRHLHISNDFAPTVDSFTGSWQLNEFRMSKLESAMFSTGRKKRSTAYDTRETSNLKHCKPDLLWAGLSALKQRRHELLSSSTRLQCTPGARQRRRCRRCKSSGPFTHELSDIFAELKSSHEFLERRQDTPSDLLMIRKRRAQQRANINQFGRPVRQRIDPITSPPQMKPVDHDHRSNITHSGTKVTKPSHQNVPRLKTSSCRPPIKKAKRKKLSSSARKVSVHTGHPAGRPASRGNSNNSRKKVLHSRQRNATNHERRFQRKHKSGESWESNEAKPAKKRFHFLSSTGTSLHRNKTQRTSWINGVIDPADENFSNKGEIRFYRGRLAKKKPKRLKKPKSTAINRSVVENEHVTNSRQPAASEEPAVPDNEEHNQERKAQRKWKSAEDVVRRPTQRFKSSKEHTKKRNGSKAASSSEGFSPEMKVNKSATSIAAKTTTTNPASPTEETTPSDLLLSTKHLDIQSGYSIDEHHRQVGSPDRLYHSASIGPIPRKSTIGPMISIIRQHLDGVEVERPLVRNNRYKPTKTPSTVRTTTELTAEILRKRRENFIAQLTTFSDSALCIARTLFDLWCVAECAAAVPFAIGLWCPMRCLFAAHIILDTLFLVISFIYSITLAVYSVILYALVDDMSVWTLFRWLGFATAVDIFLAIYIIVFIITLRCCELVVDSGKGFKHPRPISNHCSYQEVHALDGDAV